MKLHDRFFTMSKSREVFRVKRGKSVIVVVPHGMYAGTWTYNQRVLHYNTGTLQKTNWTTKKGREFTLPLPVWFYKNPDSFYKEQIGNRQQGLYRKMWSDFSWSYLEPIAKEAHQYCMEMGDTRESVLKKAVLCLSLTPTCFRQAMYAQPVKVVHILRWFVKTCILDKIGSAKRKIFIERCLSKGIKYALRKSFLKATPQTINSLTKEPATVDARILTKFCLAADYKCLVRYSNLPSNVDKELSKQILEKYGEGAFSAYYQYSMEKRRALTQRVAVPNYQDDRPQSEETYDRWHEEITRLITEANDRRSMMGRAEWEQKHKEKWAPLTLLDGIVPLVLWDDFQTESQKMHHCVQSYFKTENCFFAHIEHGGEKATVQFGSDGVIAQLYGPCNAVVSKSMRRYVSEFVEGIFPNPIFP